ncbi:MAG: amidophosphoribosyltransferase [Bacteroidales bacterium]
MSEQIKHECGIALVRLLKPQEYYLAKYGTGLYGLHKMYLLMEKQHNRGQDGAGLASIKLDLAPGKNYYHRKRSNSNSPIKDIFSEIYQYYEELCGSDTKRMADVNWLRENADFAGELFLGHLRYGTFGKNQIESVHPFIRHNNWKTRTIIIAGNFNLTNVDELFNNLVSLGQHPVETSDTITVLEKIGHFVDEENERLFQQFKAEGFSKKDISPLIADNLDVPDILSNASKHWDGGYVIAGMLGHGDAFVMRDPAGIRPAFYFKNDEIAVVTSERPVIQTAFDVPLELIHEVKPGHAIIIRRNGEFLHQQFTEPTERKSCSFERIYFSRGTDAKIYKERKSLGRHLAPAILKAINHNLKDTVFSYIPNTAAVAFRGLAEALHEYCDDRKKELILESNGHLTPQVLEEIFKLKPRIERIAVKDVKMRTFITQDSLRDDLVAHVYDVTYGSVRDDEDTLVVLDDSIVRGTTLKHSIIRILDRLKPYKIIIVSSAPQIRYPDCYGIDMTRLSEFIAFRAAIQLLKEKKMDTIIAEVYNKCKAQVGLPKEEMVNYVKEIYKPLKTSEITKKIAELLTPEDTHARVEIIYQTIEDLHASCPNDLGDWYFTGNYPTPGGNKVVNSSFINYIEGRNRRAYQW